MEKIKLNKNAGNLVSKSDNFKLSPKIQYIIDIKEEIKEVAAQRIAIEIMGLNLLDDYYNWLESNGFNSDIPNPTNEAVRPYYGSKNLWITELSQGIVVKDVNDDDYYIIMECSVENPGFEYFQIILTPGGCM